MCGSIRAARRPRCSGMRPDLRWPADAYLEAVEQARGWFSSSLVCAVATRESAPFRNVISHGLTLDDKGRKMSKSLGNTEDAQDAVNRLGADVIRLVYASLVYSSDMNLGKTIYDAVSESYRKIRNTCRFVLGNIADFDPARDAVPYAQMLEFDRFMLARTEKLKADVRKAYEAFDFQAVYHAVLNFAVIDLSSLFIDVARDRLYCGGANSRERRSAQTALYNVLDALVRILAVLIPFTADEVYSHMPGEKARERASADARAAASGVGRRATPRAMGAAPRGSRRGAEAARNDAPGRHYRRAAGGRGAHQLGPALGWRIQWRERSLRQPKMRTC